MSSKKLVLVALAVVALVSGAIDQYFYPGVVTPPTAVVTTLAGALLVFGWYRIDSSQRGYRRSPWLNVGVVLLALIALPIYFFRSRGAKGGFIATALFLVGIVGFSALGVAGQFAVYGLQS